MKLRSGSSSSATKGKSPNSNAKKEKSYDVLTICKGLVFPTVKVAVYLLLLLYVFIPILVKTNPWIQTKIIFLNNLRWPPFIDFTEPEALGLGPTRNFYLTTDDGIKLGLWHVLPDSQNTTTLPKDQYEKLLGNEEPIILYLHGNSGTRAGWHRVGLYKVLANMNFHVVVVDYRGYGDSSGSPSEDGVVSDALFIYQWIQQRKGKSPVYLWGHSLGTGVTTKMARYLCNNNEAPLGVVLESGFNNILDAATHHPMATPFKFMPWFHWLFLDTITENNIHFQSDQSITDVTPPLLILHAEDDVIVPYHLGQKLYEAAQTTRPVSHGPVEFVSFNASLRYGHKLIFMAPELPQIIQRFMNTCSDRKEL